MIHIVFYCNWGSTPSELLERYKQLTANRLGICKNLEGVVDINSASIVVFIDGVPNNFNPNLLKNKKVICFPREPFGKKNWEQFSLQYGYTYDRFFHVVTNPQFIDKDYDFLSNLEYRECQKKFSAVISNKSLGTGYQLRRNLLISLAKKYPNVCDIYGAGWNNELGDSYKGQLDGYHKSASTSNTKFNALINYRYSLCIENCSRKNYFTEKFTDTILCWTIPIYYGCPNITEYFPKNSYYYVDITKEDCLEKIIEIINSPITQENIDALTQARDLILNKYNIWNAIESVTNNRNPTQTRS